GPRRAHPDHGDRRGGGTPPGAFGHADAGAPRRSGLRSARRGAPRSGAGADRGATAGWSDPAPDAARAAADARAPAGLAHAGSGSAAGSAEREEGGPWLDGTRRPGAPARRSTAAGRGRRTA